MSSLLIIAIIRSFASFDETSIKTKIYLIPENVSIVHYEPA